MHDSISYMQRSSSQNPRFNYEYRNTLKADFIRWKSYTGMVIMFRRNDDTEKGRDLGLRSEEDERLTDEDTVRLVKYARKKLCDYYGSASPYFPMARAELTRIESMSAEEVILEAKKLGLI